MFEQVIPVLISGGVFITVTITLYFLWAITATLQRSQSRLLVDMEPLFLWVEIKTINMRFANYSRCRALFVVFTGLGLLIWIILAAITLLLHFFSPNLLKFLLQL